MYNTKPPDRNKPGGFVSLKFLRYDLSARISQLMPYDHIKTFAQFLGNRKSAESGAKAQPGFKIAGGKAVQRVDHLIDGFYC